MKHNKLKPLYFQIGTVSLLIKALTVMLVEDSFAVINFEMVASVTMKVHAALVLVHDQNLQ